MQNGKGVRKKRFQTLDLAYLKDVCDSSHNWERTSPLVSIASNAAVKYHFYRQPSPQPSFSYDYGSTIREESQYEIEKIKFFIFWWFTLLEVRVFKFNFFASHRKTLGS